MLWRSITSTVAANTGRQTERQKHRSGDYPDTQTTSAIGQKRVEDLVTRSAPV